MNNCAQQLNQLIDFVANKNSSNNGNDSNIFRPAEALPRENTFFTTSVLGMIAISHVIETKVLEPDILQNYKDIHFYAAFQRFSRVKPQLKRYTQLLQKEISVTIFGIADDVLPQFNNLQAIRLPSDTNSAFDKPELAQFWFVVLHNPKFVSMALLARELATPPASPKRLSEKLLLRRFEGFWTYDNSIINTITNILESCNV